MTTNGNHAFFHDVVTQTIHFQVPAPHPKAGFNDVLLLLSAHVLFLTLCHVIHWRVK